MIYRKRWELIFQAGGGGGAGGTERWSADIWGLGCLIWEVYNGPLPAMDQLSRLADIPRALQPVYKVENYCTGTRTPAIFEHIMEEIIHPGCAILKVYNGP